MKPKLERGERTADVRRHMDWWRKEAAALTSSSRTIEIRAGALITRLLDAIQREA